MTSGPRHPPKRVSWAGCQKYKFININKYKHIHFFKKPSKKIWPRHLLRRVPWAKIFYAFQHNKNGRNWRLFDTMLFKLMKKWEKIVFYELNISFALIFRGWKMVLNNLTLGIPNTFLFAVSNAFIYKYYMILHFNCILFFPKML